MASILDHLVVASQNLILEVSLFRFDALHLFGLLLTFHVAGDLALYVGVGLDRALTALAIDLSSHFDVVD